MTSTAAGCIVHTVGHSTRTTAELVALLAEASIGMIVDVRSIPRSRRNPQFNIDTLPGTLAACGIDYRHLAALGGRRRRPPAAAPSPNTFWRNESFRNYADYAMTGEFAEGLAQLRSLASLRRCAVMCAEAVWWRCHRRIIADYLLADGLAVLHIMGPHAIEVAALTASASRSAGGVLTYRA